MRFLLGNRGRYIPISSLLNNKIGFYDISLAVSIPATIIIGGVFEYFSYKNFEKIES